MNYLVIDLEMCNVPKKSRRDGFNCRSEIIQIGAVLLDERYNETGRLSQYVKPQYGCIDRFIEKLTGIKYVNVKHAPSVREALTHLIDWIGDREYRVLAWSNSDFNQLNKELAAKGINDERIGGFMNEENWIDYQHTFDERFGYKHNTGLEQALILCDIEAEGRLHDGLDDAANTAALIRFLENDPDFVIEDTLSKYCPDEESGFTLGSVFANLGLAC